ncbi:DUF6364 family protein [Lunatibacter salilacus]|uniref:DUF6364 family protein n=1 Tax=Lunatibacter salilacus TaxID=2483804 RepID=UPI00131E8E0C|nr:DUF6364 family protein [Lunatibacter salilacus]
MKTKLTLTIKKNVIEAAKRKAKSKGMSLSRMFEEIFEEGGSNEIKTEHQRAAERLLQKLIIFSAEIQKTISIPYKYFLFILLWNFFGV